MCSKLNQTFEPYIGENLSDQTKIYMYLKPTGSSFEVLRTAHNIVICSLCHVNKLGAF